MRILSLLFLLTLSSTPAHASVESLIHQAWHFIINLEPVNATGGWVGFFGFILAGVIVSFEFIDKRLKWVIVIALLVANSWFHQLTLTGIISGLVCFAIASFLISYLIPTEKIKGDDEARDHE